MLKILLPVDGSPSAVRATESLIETIGWYREAPSIDLVSVHLPVPRVPNLGSFVSKEMIQEVLRRRMCGHAGAEREAARCSRRSAIRRTR